MRLLLVGSSSGPRLFLVLPLFTWYPFHPDFTKLAVPSQDRRL